MRRLGAAVGTKTERRPLAMPTDIRILGAANCWEYYMPLVRQVTYFKGVEIYCSSCQYRSTTSSCPQRPLRTMADPNFGYCCEESVEVSSPLVPTSGDVKASEAGKALHECVGAQR